VRDTRQVFDGREDRSTVVLKRKNVELGEVVENWRRRDEEGGARLVLKAEGGAAVQRVTLSDRMR
jgi:hypothetical protein